MTTLEAVDVARFIPFASDAVLVSESTSTFVPPNAGIHVLRNSRPSQKYHYRFSFDIALFAPLDPWVIVGRTLIEKAFLHAFAYVGRGTTAPRAVCLYWPKDESEWKETLSAESNRVLKTTAQRLIQDIRNRSGLTLEEIAPLVGVTRRSLQHWRAGGVISARKEQRLRNLANTLHALDQNDAADVRRLLFERAKHGVRPYDLLAEGRFDSAYSVMTGRAAPIHIVTGNSTAALPLAPPLLARMSIRDSGPVGTSGEVDLRRSRRLKR